MVQIVTSASWGAVSWSEQITLGNIHFDQGLYREAIRQYESALPLAQSSLYRGVTLYRLALTHSKLAEFSAGEQCYKDALSIFRAARDYPRLAASLSGLGEIYRAEHRLDEALASERLAYSDLKLAGMPESREASAALGIMGAVLAEQHDLKGATRSMQQALTILEKTTVPDDPDVAASLNNLGVVEFGQKHFAASETLLLRALKIREARFGPEHPLIANTLLNLSSVYLEQKRYGEAGRVCRLSIGMMGRFYPANHPEMIKGQMGLAMVVHGSGDAAEAARILEWAREGLQLTPATTTAESVQLITLYSRYLRDAGERAKSRQAGLEARQMLQEFRKKSANSIVSVSELEASGFH